MKTDMRRYGGKKAPCDAAKAPDAALRTAFNILGYQDNTEAQLRTKLQARGYTADVIDDVIEKVKTLGYLDEERMLYRMVISFAEHKGYGRSRIRRELQRFDFSPSLLSSFSFDDEELSDLDFSEICYRLICRRHGERDQKTYAFLVRHGHSASDIREGYRRYAKEHPDDGCDSSD